MVDAARVARGIHWFGILGLLWPLPIGLTVTALLHRKALQVDAFVAEHARAALGYQASVYIVFAAVAVVNIFAVLAAEGSEGLTVLLLIPTLITALAVWLAIMILVPLRALAAGRGEPARAYPFQFILR